jgi:sugar phosphate isomerase/epimerase
LPLGIRVFEVRGLPGGRVPFVDDRAIHTMLEQVKRHGLKLLGISPGFCKKRLDDPVSEEEFRTGFPAAFRLMERIGVWRITVFSYRREGGRGAPVPQAVLESLHRAAELCRTEGYEMLFENVSSCWGDTGKNVAQIAQAVGVRVTWDPANAQASGETAYRDGYAHVSHLLAHVHFKNWTPDDGFVAINAGEADLAGQVAALKADGYSGYYCLEPHQWDNRAEATRENAQQLLALLRREP